MRGRWGFRIARFALIAVAAVGLFGFIVMRLWNAVLPPVTGWHELTFWRAVGLLILSRILFGAWFHGAGRGHWRRRMAERWERMTPEEREKFREGMRARCGPFRAPEPPAPQS